MSGEPREEITVFSDFNVKATNAASKIKQSTSKGRTYIATEKANIFMIPCSSAGGKFKPP